MVAENAKQFFVNENALNQAAKGLARLAEAGRRLEAAETVEDLQDAWDDFLQRTYKIYEKIKAGSKGNPQAWAWFGKIQDERRDDELLCYIHHARNADHHGFHEITKPDTIENSYRLTGDFFPDGTVEFTDSGEIIGKWNGDPIVFEKLTNRLYPLPVENYGVIFSVPTTHNGVPISEPNIISLARLSYIYVRDMIKVASALSR